MNVPGLHRASTPPGMPPPEAHRQPSKLSFGTVCSSNINRSMEAHVVLQNAGELNNIKYELLVLTRNWYVTCVFIIKYIYCI